MRGGRRACRRNRFPLHLSGRWRCTIASNNILTRSRPVWKSNFRRPMPSAPPLAPSTASRRWRGGSRRDDPQCNVAHWLISTQVEIPAPSKKLTLKGGRQGRQKRGESTEESTGARRGGAGTSSKKKVKDASSNDADASYHEAEPGCGSRWGGSFRCFAGQTREAARGHSIESRREPGSSRKKRLLQSAAARLEKLGEKQKASELREQARREAQQEQARLKREAAAGAASST